MTAARNKARQVIFPSTFAGASLVALRSKRKLGSPTVRQAQSGSDGLFSASSLDQSHVRVWRKADISVECERAEQQAGENAIPSFPAPEKYSLCVR
jgi:hypothetical protein